MILHHLSLTFVQFASLKAFGCLNSNFTESANSSQWITLCMYCSENSRTVTRTLTSSDVLMQFTHVISFRGILSILQLSHQTASQTPIPKGDWWCSRYKNKE